MPILFNLTNITNNTVRHSAKRKNSPLNQSNRTRPPVIIDIPQDIKSELDNKNRRHCYNPDDTSLESSTEVTTIDGNDSFASIIMPSDTKVIHKRHKSEENQVPDDDTETPTIDAKTACINSLSKKEKALKEEHCTEKYIQEYCDTDTISMMSHFTNEKPL